MPNTFLESLALQQERYDEREDAERFREDHDDDAVRTDRVRRVRATPGRFGDLRAGDADPESRAERAKTDRDASAKPGKTHALLPPRELGRHGLCFVMRFVLVRCVLL